MTTIYVQRPEAEVDENSQQLVWLDRKPEPFEESDIVLYPARDGQIVDLASAKRIIPLQTYADGIEVEEVFFVD